MKTFEIQAQAALSRGDAKTIDEAYSLVASQDPALYKSYLLEVSASEKEAATEFKPWDLEEMAAGRIAAGHSSEFYEACEQVAASNPGIYEAYKNGLGKNQSRPVTEASESDFISAAHAKVSAGLAPDFYGACSIVASEHPSLYREYQRTMGKPVEAGSGEGGGLVTAICNALPGGGEVPDEIVYIPEGTHKIFPGSHPKGITVKLDPEKGEQVAAAFNAGLQQLMRETVKPWVDFEHTAKHPSAGVPTGFRYQRGEGILCAMDWSASGRRAIKGKDVNYFSPRFDLDTNGVPTSLPSRGPIGGLVTEPAFRNIRPIAASLADPVGSKSQRRIEAHTASLEALGPHASARTVRAHAVSLAPDAFA